MKLSFQGSFFIALSQPTFVFQYDINPKESVLISRVLLDF